jgi:hypothetical protein
LRLDAGGELGEFDIVDRHRVLRRGVSASAHVGVELLVRGDPFLLEAREFRGEIAISLGVPWLMAMRVSEHVLGE